MLPCQEKNPYFTSSIYPSLPRLSNAVANINATQEMRSRMHRRVSRLVLVRTAHPFFPDAPACAPREMIGVPVGSFSCHAKVSTHLRKTSGLIPLLQTPSLTTTSWSREKQSLKNSDKCITQKIYVSLPVKRRRVSVDWVTDCFRLELGRCVSSV